MSVPSPSTFWADARALAWPTITYWVATLGALLAFTVLVLVFEGHASDDVAALAGFWIATAAGLALGQTAALLRLRSWVVVGLALALGVAWFLAIFAFAMVNPDQSDTMLAVVLAWMLFPFFLVSGLWSLRVHMGLLATWAPLVYLTACVLVISDETGADERWFAGDKYAIWSVATAPLLVAGVAVVVVYLATREIHRLHRWRNGDRGPLPAPTPPGRRAALPTPGCGGVLALVALVAVLSLGSALIAPYLWRTAPDDGTGDHEHPTEPDAPPPPDDLPQGDEPVDGSGGGRGTGERVVEAARQAGIAMLWLLLMLLLALLALLLFGPPLRRALLLQHLRRPLWPVPPSRRIRNHWRVVRIALGDLGVHAEPGDTATTLAHRAVERLPELDPMPLLDCAEVVDRANYGLGLQPDDTMRARRHAEMSYQAVWDFLSETDKIKAMYRWL